jgi:ParB-like chromosome segregation protein Spo0J
MRKVNLNQIRIDGGTQCRVVLNQSKIYEYLQCMKDGDEFPLIEARFDGATYWLTDGFHRYHAYKLLGLKEVTISYKPGTQAEAILDALRANSKHGLTLSHEDKENKVKMALALPDGDKMSNYEIAKLCDVSQPFVAGVRDPEKKKKQKEAKEKNIKKKAEELHTQEPEVPPTTNQISSEKTTVRETPDLNAGVGPDEDELRANELALQADMDIMYKMLEADDALATAHEEIKRLNLAYAQLDVRFKGLMNERNQAVKMVKELQKQIDKSKAKK